MKCLHCQKSLVLQRSTKKYCDDKCRKYARRKRLAGQSKSLSGTQKHLSGTVSGTNRVISGTDVRIVEPTQRRNPYTGRLMVVEDSWN